MEKEKIISKYPNLKGIMFLDHYEDGIISSCKLEEQNEIITSVGKLIPRYGEPDMRRKDSPSMTFYKEGSIKSISLEKQTDIVTPIGVVPAERITFYKNGSIHSIFPVDGKLTFAWSENDEKEYNKPLDFTFSFGDVHARIISLRFYESGNVKSLTLWPDEMINIKVKNQIIPIRIGFRLFENGQIQSFEPAVPIQLGTLAGVIKAYDKDAIGMEADQNSVELDKEGNLSACVTSGVIYYTDWLTGKSNFIPPVVRIGMEDDFYHYVPTKFDFSDPINLKVITGDKETIIGLNQYTIEIKYDKELGTSGCEGDCGKCGGSCF